MNVECVFLCNVQELALLQAILAHKRGAGLETVSPILKEATELHFQALQGRPMGPEYFHLLHPNFIFQVVNLHLSYFQVCYSASLSIITI